MAFASTSSSDLSIGEHSRLTTLRKRKRILSTACSRPVRAAKQKALTGLRETDSDEENIYNPLPEPTVGPDRKRRSTVSVKALPKRKVRKRMVLESNSESEEETAARSRVSSCGPGEKGHGLKAGNSVELPSYRGRFVTNRRRAAPERPKVLQPSRTGKTPRVSVGHGSWNSSEDFVNPERLASRKRASPVQKQELRSENTSSEFVRPVSNLSRARSILKGVSLNRTADKTLESSYKRPLLSSTPSMASRPSYRHQEPSISEISCSMDDMEDVFKSSMEATRGLASPRQRELKVVMESSVEMVGSLRARPPVSEKVGLPFSAGKNCVGVPQHSRELFSHIDCELEVRNGARMVENVPSLENLSVQFVSADTHLESFAASLRERGTAVVLLEKTDLSRYLNDKRDKQEEDAYSSCVDSESALKSRSSDGKVGTGVEAPREIEGSVPGFSDESQGDDSWQIRENDELRGAGFRRGDCEKSASVLCISSSSSPGSLCKSGGGRLEETKRGSFGKGDVVRPTVNLGARVSVAEQSKVLFSETSDEIEREERSGEALPAPASCEEVFPSPPEAAVSSCPLPAGSAEACLKERCLSVRATVTLEALNLPKLTQGRGDLRAPGSDSAEELEREAGISEGDRQRSPVSGESRVQLGSSSPERPGSPANPERDGGKPSDRLRRKLSTAFASDAAVPTCASSSFAPSPGGKRGPGRAKNQGGPPKDKPGTGRKACISGLSVSRWAKNDPHRQRQRKCPSQSQLSRAGDCSLFDFQPTLNAKKRPDIGSNLFQGTSGLFPGTPLRTDPLSISSLLANFTPESLTTHNWSRLKAALSVHKKKKAFFTPMKLSMSHSEVLGDGSPRCTPFSCHQRASLLRSTTATPLSQSLLEDITDAEKLYHECQQDGPILFEQCLPPPRMKLCKKVGEGTFGEVFTTTNHSNETVALKIVPIEGRQKVNGEDQKTFGEILHEVIISKELSCLDAKEMNKTNGFIGLNDLHCVRGSYPKPLLSAWDKFDKQRRSENDRPDFFEEDQLFLILEFEFGGSDLEAMNGKLSSLAVAKSILHQVTAALAVAEQALCFEHRDLHWGNILVKTTKEKAGTYLLNGTSHSYETKGIHVNIIDYSLSRLEIDGLTVSCDISADEELFMGQGDYQFDIYRQMRQENNNSWSEFNPRTNVLWIHYLADKLLHMSYRQRIQSKPMKNLKRSIKDFHRELLAYKSAATVLECCSLFQEA
ncbi:hypothetical protein SKAU_G00344250 [Synaphobranchus kaupii]|uniref:Serine/threonine-protein kinase haspin n=1 Tax=Synaphobranchus kaupii TaxID=118154 RepID=A0A9Q1EJ72_SYNKA|nr:hypothetical protein SKAU_G00344250 [Synaphobranchus kaupii]